MYLQIKFDSIRFGRACRIISPMPSMIGLADCTTSGPCVALATNCSSSTSRISRLLACRPPETAHTRYRLPRHPQTTQTTACFFGLLGFGFVACAGHRCGTAAGVQLWFAVAAAGVQLCWLLQESSVQGAVPHAICSRIRFDNHPGCS